MAATALRVCGTGSYIPTPALGIVRHCGGMEGDPGGFITPDLRIVVRDWRRGGHVREHDRGGGMSVRSRDNLTGYRWRRNWVIRG